MPDVSNVASVSATAVRDPGVRRADADDFGGAVGEALEGFGEAVGEAGATVGAFVQKLEREKEETALASAEREGQKRLNELAFTLEEDPDFATSEARFNEGADGILESLLPSLPESVRDLYKQRFDMTRSIAGLNVRRNARQKQIKHGRDQLAGNLEAFGDSFALAETDLERQDVLDMIGAALGGAVDSGLVTGEEAAQRQSALLDGAEETRVRRLMLGDPEATLEALNDPAQFPFLDPDTRVRLQVQTQERVEFRQDQRLRESERAERMADRETQQARDTLGGEMVLQILDPEQEITQERILEGVETRSISPAQGAALQAAFQSEETFEDDPAAALSLRREAVLGDPAFVGQLSQALVEGSLSRETALQLARQHKAASGGGGLQAREDVRLARAQLDKAVSGARGPFNQLDGAASVRTANALGEFDRLLAEAAEQGAVNPDEIAQSVAGRFRPARPSVSDLPRPAFLVGPRNRPNIDATRRATLAAFDAGQIDRATAARDLERLERLEDALQDGIEV